MWATESLQSLTCEAVAMYERGSPIFGAHATSRTQSVWPSRTSSSTHACESSRKPHILTKLSQPALANRFTPCGVACCGVMRDPGSTAGAQETALHPMACPLKMSAPQVPSSESQSIRISPASVYYTLLKVKTESFPSDEAQATIAPSSCGAQETEFTACPCQTGVCSCRRGCMCT
jgi:hypothetical protein